MIPQNDYQYIAKPLTPGEVAKMYNVTTRTLKTWTDMHKEKIGKRAAKYFSTLQVIKIFECIGCPTAVVID